MRPVRIFLVTIACALWALLCDVVAHGGWERHSERWWLVYVIGLVVIAVVGTVADGAYRARQARRAHQE